MVSVFPRRMGDIFFACRALAGRCDNDTADTPGALLLLGRLEIAGRSHAGFVAEIRRI